MEDHDTTLWHPWDGTHHHGYDPKSFLNTFGEPLEFHLDTFGEIGFPWRTSEHEEHEGYVWLYTEMRPGETIFNNGGQLPVDTMHYVRKALMQVHTDGTMHHARKRFHSHTYFLEIENRFTGQKGVVYGGGWVDYGWLHTPYKKTRCVLPSDPPGFKDLNQQPYRAVMTRFDGQELVHFWSGLWPNQIVKQFFPDDPQHILGVAWSGLDGREYPDTTHCNEEEYDKVAFPEGSRKFQIFTVAVRNLPSPGSFIGVTDRWGHVVPNDDGGWGVDQVPLWVSAGVPQGIAMLNRPVRQGDNDAAPIMMF